MTTVPRSDYSASAGSAARREGSNGTDRVRLQCARCRSEMPYTAPDENKCRTCGWEWLDLVYRGVTRDDIITGDDALGRTSMWRYRKFLPIASDCNIVS